MSLSFNEFKSELIPNLKTVRSYLRSLTRNDVNADDLLQDTVEKALKNYQSFERGTNMEAWLVTIAKNVFFDWKKSHVVSRTTNFGEDVIEMPLGGGQFESVQVEELQEYLDTLPDRERIILLMWAEGCNYQEIGDLLDLSRENVGAILSRVRKKIFSRFGELDEAE